MAVSSSLIAFVVSILLIFRFAWGQNKSQDSCPESFVCGSIDNMSYPFSRDPNCGLCVVDCDAKPGPKINLSSEGDWYVDGSYISTNTSFITVHAPRLENPGCHSFDKNITLPNTPSISFTILHNITLFKCNIISSSSPTLDSHFSGYDKFTSCEDHGFHIYYTLDRDRRVSGTLPPSCSIIQLPLAPRDNPYVNPDDLYTLLTSKFDLEWHLSVACYDCHLKGHQCLTDSENKFYCSEGIGESTSAPQVQGKHNIGMILGIAASAGGVVILAVMVFCLRRKCSIFSFESEEYQNVETFLKNYGSLAPKRYHYFEVKKMTNSFKIRLGQGGFGSVYKGKTSDDRLVAVKILSESKGNGEEFINEVASISRTSHVNIVKLLGFCFERNKRALIYEFMPNGSLEKFIYDEKSLLDRQLGWQTLYKISTGIARGLEYLHRGCNTQILHFDIKPHNILLDEEFSPKISDFGLSKLCTREKSIVSMLGARGTIGYIAPEVVCRTFGGVSHKSDVYSYGMMILEMVGGRRNVDVGVDHTSEIYYPHWIYKQLELNEELGFDGISDEEEKEKARKMIIVSLWCIQTDPSIRPSMSKVVEMLEGNLESLQIPPKPYLYSPSRSPVESSSIQIV